MVQLDTGAEVSVFPAAWMREPTQPTMVLLCTATGEPMPARGEATLTFKLGAAWYAWRFVLADVSTPLLGFDFLQAWCTKTDWASGRFELRWPQQPRVAAVREVRRPGWWQHLLDYFATVFAPPDCTEEPGPTVSRFHLWLELEEGYVPPRLYGVPPKKLERAAAATKQMIDCGVLEPAASVFRAPMVFVEKKDGSLRPAADFRQLNAVTKVDPYPMPAVRDIFVRLAAGRWFAVLDLRQGFWQIGIRTEDRWKTAVQTPQGHFQFTRVPFGLKNSPKVFQRMIDEFVADLPDTEAYVDDLIVHADTEENLNSKLQAVLQKAQEWKLHFNPDKVQLGTEVQFLGHKVSGSGFAPLESNVRPIRDFPVPTSKKAVRRFNGMVNFYRAYLPGIAAVQQPLSALTSTKTRFSWTAECQAAFEECKRSLEAATTMAFPVGQMSIVTDASDVGLGAVLQADGRPAQYASRTLTEAEKKYSATEKELLAVQWALRKFRYYVIGGRVDVYTDHKALVGWRSLNIERPRVHRALEELEEYDLYVHHQPGAQNGAADALSRIGKVEMSPLMKIVEGQQEDTECRKLREALSLQQPLSAQWTGVVDEGGILMRKSGSSAQWVVPAVMRGEALRFWHEALGHPAGRRLYETLQARLYWPGMRKDVQKFCEACQQCQRCKATKTEKVTPLAFNATDKFQFLHIDLVGPLPAGRGGVTHILSMVDKFSRWVELEALKSTTTAQVIRILEENWLDRYGPPVTLVTDQGPQFMSAEFKDWCAAQGIRHVHTAAYHPQTNATAERAHRSIKEMLRCWCVDNPGGWRDRLSKVARALRSTVSTATGYAPAAVLWGKNNRLPGEPTMPTGTTQYSLAEVADRVEAVRKEIVGRQRQAYSATPRQTRLQPGDWVMMREVNPTALQPRNQGPYRVVDVDRARNTVHIAQGDKPRVAVALERLSRVTAPPDAAESSSPSSEGGSDVVTGNCLSLSAQPVLSRAGRRRCRRRGRQASYSTSILTRQAAGRQSSCRQPIRRSSGVAACSIQPNGGKQIENCWQPIGRGSGVQLMAAKQKLARTTTSGI